MKAISKHNALWSRYFHDFTREQLSLWLHNQQVIEETLRATFGAVCIPPASNISQLASLHVYAYLNEQNILKTVSAIGPLIKLSSIMEHLSYLSSTSSPISNTKAMDIFVMNTLFALLNYVEFQTSNSSLELWYNAYHTMVNGECIDTMYLALTFCSVRF